MGFRRRASRAAAPNKAAPPTAIPAMAPPPRLLSLFWALTTPPSSKDGGLVFGRPDVGFSESVVGCGDTVGVAMEDGGSPEVGFSASVVG